MMNGGTSYEEFRHDVFTACQHPGENLADEPVGMGIGIAYTKHSTFVFVEGGNPLQGVIVEAEHLLGIGQELEAYLGQGNGTGGAVKELGVQLRLRFSLWLWG